MLVVASRWKSGPGSCQETRKQVGGADGKRSVPKPDVESPMGEANVRSAA